MPHRALLPLLALLLAALGPPPEDQRAIPGQRSGFVADGAGGCWIWVGGLPAAAEGVAGSWTGTCPEGPAEGEGRAVTTWRAAGRERQMVYEGRLRAGKAEGQGRLSHYEEGRLTVREEGEYRDDYLVGGRFEIPAAGLVYEGGWFRDGPHGQGRLQVEGRSFEGRWELGCLKAGDLWIAFTRPPKSCEDGAT
ncbi:hypothetical protein [Paracraurococcus ruber]|uniref:MORN repeat-containing protein n=1 Tax=Paracraurococcus ruber TaxID=77675 RepID=A0ABS1D400_9PROT|nr:hypothetical protein [Paracraurococcus ruber]MBK1661180.1 hypothetical protein [Paracraurococcus ruber]TDG29318.1 hypothetical protein E2C05_18140 [Paracraurococcus ruber]